jgi:hypothetical protein
MSIDKLEREYHILKHTARKSTNPKQQLALEYQVKELEHELARARGRGVQAMLQAAGDVQDLPLQPAVGEQPAPPLPVQSPHRVRHCRLAIGVYGEPIPQPTWRGFELPDDDPWVKLQHQLLVQAQSEGNVERANWYQYVLGER